MVLSLLVVFLNNMNTLQQYLEVRFFHLLEKISLKFQRLNGIVNEIKA